MNILEQLAAHAKERVALAEQACPLEIIREKASRMEKGDGSFEKALKRPGLSFICECKKASPSRGVIAKNFPYLQIAREYQEAGADAVSVLTEPKWFLGSDRYLREIAETVSLPCLRKDFTVDEYMIYEAKLLGASAVLLICSILSSRQLREYLQVCETLGLSALVETHDEGEVDMALEAGARIIGVNNRNLRDFSVDTENSRRLREQIPAEVLFVSESGVRTAADAAALREIGADAVLVGEAMMRATDKRAMLAELSDIETANALQPDYIGFVFAKKSRRCVSPEEARSLKQLLSPDIRSVGVFVNEDPEVVAGLLNENVIDIAQLHGSEDEAYFSRLRTLTDRPLIQAFRIASEEDLHRAEASSADEILLDAGAGGGTAFDWSLLKGAKRRYFLAGGLNPQNVKAAIRDLHPYALDVSSGIETGGKKDPEKMAAFVTAVREEDIP